MALDNEPDDDVVTPFAIVDLITTPTALVTNDAAIVNRSGSVANVILGAAATRAVGAGGVQAYSSVLAATTASFLIADEVKLDALPTNASLTSLLAGKQPIATVLTNTTASFTTALETKLNATISYSSLPAVLSVPLVDINGVISTWTPYVAQVLPPASFPYTDTSDPPQMAFESSAAYAARLLGGATVAGSVAGIAVNDGPLIQLTPAQVTAQVAAASLTAAGKVELATATEINTGTDTTRAIGVDEFAASIFGAKEFGICVFDSNESVTVGNGTQGIPAPGSMTGMDVTGMRVSVHTKGITGTTNVQLRRRRNGVDVNVLSTVITLGDEWTVADGVINTANDDIAAGDLFFIDRPAVHTTAPLGLSATIIARVP